MSASASSTSPIPEVEREPLTKRKLRKGTRSCWECKRRKIRCFYASNNDPICVSCVRRGTSCISQEFSYEPPIGDEDANMRGRLLRVEALLGKLIEKVMPEGAEPHENGNGPAEAMTDTPMEEYSRHPSAAAEAVLPGNYTTMPSRSASSWEGPRNKASFMRAQYQEASKTQFPYSSPGFEPSILAGGDRRYEKIRKAIHAAFPSQQTADWLVEAGYTFIFFHLITNPYSSVYGTDILPPSIQSALPNVNSHPALLARALLQLAVCLQRLAPDEDISGLDLVEPIKDLRAKYLDLATSLVTTNEKLLDSVEGLQCLMLEGIYLVNDGNLRRAWLCIRRATSLAQFMGFHRAHPRATRVLDPRTTRVSGPDIWFRLAYTDRYLSLLLSLPSGISSNSFASEEAMLGSTSSEKMDRVHAVIALRIIERNETDNYHEFATTQAIDYDLQRAAKTVPPKWWNIPDLQPGLDGPTITSDVLRGQTQIIHYNLLTIVHLPFMLRNGMERRYDYSKITSIYASREVLTRFIPFRAYVRVAYCCRLVDFCAFTASFALLLAHLDSHRNSYGDILSHQRLNDRALIERAMETMDALNRVSGDTLSMQTAEVIRKLLAVEADAADGNNSYSTSNVSEEDNIDGQDQSFRLKIPYLGTVKIARDTLIKLQAQTLTSTSMSNASVASQALTPESSVANGQALTQTVVDPSQIQNWQSALHPFATSDHHQPHQQQGHDQSNLPLISFQDDGNGQLVTVPNLTADADDWAFQGVDVTFFDSVLKGDLAEQMVWDAEGGSWSFLQ